MFWTGLQIDATPFHGVAHEFIRRQIQSGAMRPDEQFPAERKLAEALGLSRATLREALKMLETEGYLAALRGAKGGNFVTSEGEIDRLAHIHMLSNPDLVWRSLEYLRAVLDHGCLLSCQRRSPTDLSRLRHAADGMLKAVSGGEAREAQHLFFSTLGRSTLNDFFVKAVQDALVGLFHPLPGPEVFRRREKLVALWHQMILALEARDTGSASVHSRAVTEEISTYILDIMGRPPAPIMKPTAATANPA